MAVNKRQYSYSFTKKGYRYEEFGKYDQTTEAILDDNGNVIKPASSNTPVVVFDTGNAYIEGKCYDHHQLSQEMKLKYPSATAVLIAKRKSFYEAHKDDEKIKFVCHDFPDNDAIISVTLATILMECEGKYPLVADELVRIANESDTFTYKSGFNFGSLLDKYTKSIYPKDSNSRNLKAEAITTCVNFCYQMSIIYSRLARKIEDKEERKNFTMENMLEEIIKKDSDFSKQNPQMAQTLREIKASLNKQAQQDMINYDEMKKHRVTVKDRDNLQLNFLQNVDTYREGYTAYDEMSIPLCKRQISKEEQKLPLEKSEKDCKVFIYTGTKNPSNGIKVQSREKYDVTVIPEYDDKKGTVTVKISSQRPDVDLGHFGRYIETIMFKEKLNKEDSIITDKKEFIKEREEFIKRLQPLSEAQEKRHFTSYDSLCGNDPTFFGFTVEKNSCLYSLTNLKSFMQDYFADPQKIKKQDFIDMIGEENFDEIEMNHRPDRYMQKMKEKEEAELISDEAISEIANSGLTEGEIIDIAKEIVEQNENQENENGNENNSNSELGD